MAGILRLDELQSTNGSTAFTLSSDGSVAFSGGLTLPVWTTATRPATPQVGLVGFNNTYLRSEIWTGSSWTFLGTSPIGLTPDYPASSAVSIRQANPEAPSGVYYITWGSQVYPIYCEMELAGGGWMMILNYIHLGGTNPNLLVRTNSFPHLGSKYTLGPDESGSTGVGGTWGHIGNDLANEYNWTEYMFYGRTSFHNRVIHFTGNNTNIVSYIKTGSGTMDPSYADTATNSNVELYNNATIPFYVNNDRSGYSNQNDLAMTNFPIYGNSTIGNPRAHWGIKGGGNRWEVDDYPSSQGGTVDGSSTIHRILVR